jgi:hypothetical protein
MTGNFGYRWVAGVKTLKHHQGSNPPHLLELREAYTPVILTNLVASYNYAEQS